MHSLQQQSGDVVEDLTIAVIGGGSRNWAVDLMNDLGLSATLSGTVRLYDVDVENAKRNAELGRMIDDHPDAIGDWRYRAVDTLDDALDGADFVVCSTQDPPAETMAHDLDIPAEYGIYQSVGDTVGPGGTFRAMRAIPQYREIAAGVREHCPDAWVLNYTNPMTICTRTLYEEYPDINAIGLCHEVYNTQGFLASLAESAFDDAMPTREEIDVTVAGINHCTWIRDAFWNGHDLMGLVESELGDGDLPPFEPGDMAEERYTVDTNAITADLYRRFGVLPAAGDRHLAEFVPWYLDIDESEAIHRWGIRLTPSTYRVDRWPTGERSRDRLLSGETTFAFEDTGEEMVDVMRALLGLEPLKTNANVPNRGQVAGLPDGAVVETNVLFTANKAAPLAAGSLPRQVCSILQTHVDNQETLVEAGFDGDLDVAYRAFLNDPLVTVDPESARSLFIDLVEAQRPYLEAWNLDSADVLID